MPGSLFNKVAGVRSYWKLLSLHRQYNIKILFKSCFKFSKFYAINKNSFNSWNFTLGKAEQFHYGFPEKPCGKMLDLQKQSSRGVLLKKGVLTNLAKFTGKHLRQSLFFNQVGGLRPTTLLKRRLWRMCFPVNFVKFLRTPFFTEHPWWLLLLEYICK